MKFRDFLLVLILLCPLALVAHGPLDEQIAKKTEEIRQNPGNAMLYLERGELHRHHEDWPKALADYDTAESLDPELDIVDLARGKMYFDAGRFEEAVPPLQRFLQSNPEHPDALVVRARVRARLNQNLAAAQDFTRAIALYPTPKPEFYLERAQALVVAGPEYIQEALRGLDEGVQVMGPIVTLQLYAIDLEVQSENYDAALSRLDAVAAQSARQEKWLKRRGEILLQAGRVAEARAAFEQALHEIEVFAQRRRKSKATLRLEEWLRNTLATLSKKPN